MKTMKIRMLIALIIIAGNVGAKNNTISFDAQFKAIGSTSVEPNEVIVLTGEYDPSTVLNFKLSTYILGVANEVKVNLTNTSWSAQIGPFLPNQSVVLKFEISEKMSESDFVRFRSDFETAFTSTMKWIEVNRPKHPEYDKSDSLYMAFAQHFSSVLPIGFQRYKSKDNTPAAQILLNALNVNQKDNIFNYHNNLNTISNKQQQFNSNKQAILSSISDSTQKTAASLFIENMAGDTALVDTSAVFTQYLSASAIDTTGIGGKIIVLKYNLKELANNHNKIIVNNKKVAGILKEFDILKTSELTSSLDNSTTLTIDIHQYMGFDIVPVTYLGDNRPGSPFGILFTVSPYLGRVNPDDKIRNLKPLQENKDQKHTRKWGNFVRCVTPTIGLALSNSTDSTQVKPIVFAGVGIRINPLVRFTTGVSVYVPTGTKSPVACITCGLGIRIDYVAEILKSFTTANSNL